MQNSQTTSASPTPIAWIACSISLLFVTFVASITVEIGEYLRKKESANRIKYALDGSNLGLGKEFLFRALNEQGIAGWFTFSETGDQSLERLINLSYETIELSESANFTLAIARLETLRSTLPATSEIRSKDELEALLKDLRPVMESLSKLNQKRQSRQSEVDKLSAERRKLASSFYLLAREFADFLSLAPVQREDSQELLAYERGVLANLPQLGNLEDGIPDLRALARALEFARGEVQLEEGANAHQVFNQRMNYFRGATTPLVRSNREIETQMEGLQSYLDGTEKELRNIHVGLRGKLRTILFKLLETDRSPSFETFEHIGNYLELLLF